MTNFDITESQLRAIVRDELRQLFKLDTPEDSETTEFLPTSKAFVRLGYCSRQKLTEDIKNGTLRIGIEVQDRRSPGASQACYYFNLNACIKRLNVPPERRN